MNILAINTSQKVGEIALRVNEKTSNKFLTETKSFSENILVAIDKILKDNNLTINNIDIISVVCGPGSFTGTRIGISLVKGIVMALPKIKVVALNVFDVLKESIENKNCIIVENSGVGDFYFARIENNKIVKIDSSNMEELSKQNLKVYDSIDINNDNNLVKATMKKVLEKDFCKLENMEPIYVKFSQAQREFKKKIETEISIKQMEIENIKDVMNIENECFLNDKYSQNIFEDEIKNNKYFVAKIKDEIVGFVGFSLIENEAELLKIAIKNNYAQMGIGTLLIQNFISKMKNVNKIYLEVSEKNITARNFYKKLHFIETGCRKDYYGKSNSAILMEWNTEK